MDSLKDLAAALDGHQITDTDGQIPDGDTSAETTAAQEDNAPVIEPAPAEKPAESATPAPQGEEADDETQLAEDETGKRYVPEKRFKEIYGKAKQLEREMEALKSQRSQVTAPTQKNRPTEQPSKADLLEVEILRQTLPQFNPDSPEYSAELDEMGAEIYQANPGITRPEAARRALQRVNKLAETLARTKNEARQVKAIQADQGITNRVASRGDTIPNTETMSDQEMERYLKENGAW